MKTETKQDRPKKPRNDRPAAPPVNGTMNCRRGHSWEVVDLNVEKISATCPVCGDTSSIRQGFVPSYVPRPK